MTLVDRHEALRVRFREDASGSFWQRPVPIEEVDLAFDEHDLRDLPRATGPVNWTGSSRPRPPPRSTF